MQIFETRFWGFTPEREPFVGFTYPGSQASLIRKSNPGDQIVILGTQNTPTAPEERGMLLGLIEFERVPANAEDLLPIGQPVPAHLLDDQGRFRWPYAVPALKAWRFEKPYPIKDIIGRQLTMAATSSVDRLSDDEAALILNLPKVEIDLGASRAQTRFSRLNLNARLPPNSSGQPGPAPSTWSSMTSHEDGPTATYLLRFGNRDCWKIGISQNPTARMAALNFSVPSEVLGEQWQLTLHHVWPDGASAYQMEQAILTHLSAHCTQNERVRCSERVVNSAWTEYLQGRI